MDDTSAVDHSFQRDKAVVNAFEQRQDRRFICDIADYAHEEIDLVGATTYVAFLTRYAASKEAESKDPENSLSQVNKGNYFFYLVDADGKPTFRIELRVCHNQQDHTD